MKEIEMIPALIQLIQLEQYYNNIVQSVSHEEENIHGYGDTLRGIKRKKEFIENKAKNWCKEINND